MNENGDDFKIYLPSSFSESERHDLGLDSLGTIEARLRVSMAHEILRKLRFCLGVKGFLVRDQQAGGQGTKQATRSHADISRQSEKVHRYAAVYKKNFKAMQRLGVDFQSYAKHGLLQELHEEDLHMLKQWSEVDREASGTTQKGKRPLVSQDRPLPWFWQLVTGFSDVFSKGNGAPCIKLEEGTVAKEIEDYNYRGQPDPRSFRTSR